MLNHSKSKILKKKKANFFLHSFGGASWVVMITIYYTLFILAIYGAETIDGSVSTDYGFIDGVDPLTQCTTPQYEWDSQTGSKEEVSFYRSLDCLRSRGVTDETTCNAIEGCTWENVTSGWWLWETTDDASCVGTINASYYNVSTVSFLGVERVASHNNTNFEITVCNAPAVIDNETLCNMFSCSWGEEQDLYEEVTVFTVIGQLFTFSYTFTETNAVLNYLLTFIFVYLPLIMLIIALLVLVNPLK